MQIVCCTTTLTQQLPVGAANKTEMEKRMKLTYLLLQLYFDRASAEAAPINTDGIVSEPTSMTTE